MSTKTKPFTMERTEDGGIRVTVNTPKGPVYVTTEVDEYGVATVAAKRGRTVEHMDVNPRDDFDDFDEDEE